MAPSAAGGQPASTACRRGRGERGRRTPRPGAAPPGRARRAGRSSSRASERSERCRSSTRGPPVSSRQPVGQPGFEPVQAERREPGGGQLDRQRHAVEPPADGGDPAGVRRRQRAPGRGGAARGTAPPRRPGRRRRPRWTAPAPGTPTRTAPAAGPGWWPAPTAAGCPRAAARAAPARRPAGARSCPAPAASPAAPASRATVSSAERAWRSPRPSAAAMAGAIMAGSVTGTRSTYQAPSANRPATSATTLSASRVLPTPPGPTAVTRRCVAQRRGQRGPLGRPPDERGQRRRAAAAASVRGRARPPARAQGRRRGRQRPAVVHLELAQQRGDVALDGADGDEQPGGDLGVGQVLAERGQHLGLAGGHAHPGSHRASSLTLRLCPTRAAPGRPRVNAVSAWRGGPGPAGGGPVRRTGRRRRPARASSNSGVGRVVVRGGRRVAVRRAGAEEDERAGHLLQHEGEVLRAGDRAAAVSGSGPAPNSLA